MEIIDKRGRLFGVINIIDFFVLLFILSMVVGMPLACMKMKRTQSEAVESNWWRRYTPCQYCDGELYQQTDFGEKPPEDIIRKTCPKCGNEQDANFSKSKRKRYFIFVDEGDIVLEEK